MAKVKIPGMTICKIHVSFLNGRASAFCSAISGCSFGELENCSLVLATIHVDNWNIYSISLQVCMMCLLHATRLFYEYL